MFTAKFLCLFMFVQLQQCMSAISGIERISLSKRGGSTAIRTNSILTRIGGSHWIANRSAESISAVSGENNTKHKSPRNPNALGVPSQHHSSVSSNNSSDWKFRRPPLPPKVSPTFRSVDSNPLLPKEHSVKMGRGTSFSDRPARIHIAPSKTSKRQQEETRQIRRMRGPEIIKLVSPDITNHGASQVSKNVKRGTALVPVPSYYPCAGLTYCETKWVPLIRKPF